MAVAFDKRSLQCPFPALSVLFVARDYYLCLLAVKRIIRHDVGMFLVTDADAAAIHEAYDRAGELAAVVELRQRFRGISDNEQARMCVRSIIGWRTPVSLPDANP